MTFEFFFQSFEVVGLDALLCSKELFVKAFAYDFILFGTIFFYKIIVCTLNKSRFP